MSSTTKESKSSNGIIGTIFASIMEIVGRIFHFFGF